MLKKLSLALLIFLPAIASAETQDFTFDKHHTSIQFSLDHLGFSSYRARFLDFDGTLSLDEKKPENSKLNVVVRPKGIRTDLDEFDAKLQGEKFFNSAKFPEATFKSTKIERTGEKTAKVTGDFTLLGVTKPVTFDVTLYQIGEEAFCSCYKAGFSAKATIKRSDFGMSEYVPYVGDEVTLTVETEMQRPMKGEKLLKEKK